MNNHVTPYANTAKYLGMNISDLDGKNTSKTKKEWNIKYRKLYWLFGRGVNTILSLSAIQILSTQNKKIIQPLEKIQHIAS